MARFFLRACFCITIGTQPLDLAPSICQLELVNWFSRLFRRIESFLICRHLLEVLIPAHTEYWLPLTRTRFTAPPTTTSWRFLSVTAQNQLDYAYASRGFHEHNSVRALNSVQEWGAERSLSASN